MGIIIKGIGMNLPKKMLTNKDMEKIVDTTDEWIIERTGIKNRYVSEKDEAASDLALPACKEAIASAGLTHNDIDLIIVATVTPDYIFPTTACVLQKKLEMQSTPAFDILAGCSGFIFAMETAQNFLLSNRYKNILVVSSEELTKITDFTDRNTAVLFGDGAAAVVLSHDTSKKGILSSYITSDGSKYANLIMLGGGSVNPASIETVNEKMHFIKMNGRAVFKDAVETMIFTSEQALKKANLTKKDISLVIPHQANIRIIEAIIKYFEIDPSIVQITVDKYANMSSATIPIALYDALKNNKIKEGDKVLLTAFGAGFTAGAMILQY